MKRVPPTRTRVDGPARPSAPNFSEQGSNLSLSSRGVWSHGRSPLLRPFFLRRRPLVGPSFCPGPESCHPSHCANPFRPRGRQPDENRLLSSGSAAAPRLLGCVLPLISLILRDAPPRAAPAPPAARALRRRARPLSALNRTPRPPPRPAL